MTFGACLQYGQGVKFGFKVVQTKYHKKNLCDKDVIRIRISVIRDKKYVFVFLLSLIRVIELNSNL